MRILALFLPCCLNMLSSLIFFISTSRIQQESDNAFLATSALAVWAVLYTVTSFVLCRLQNNKNAVWIIEASLAVLVLDMFAFVIFSSLQMQFLWLVISGVCCAGFFAPFQLFFKQVNVARQDPSVGHQTSLFLFSWSFGFASGNLLAAWLWGMIDPENGWRICYIISAVLMIVVLGSVEICRRYIRRRTVLPQSETDENCNAAAAVEVEDGNRVNFEVPPNLMKVMFFVGFIGCITVAVIRSPLTLHLEAHQISLAARSGILALQTYVQAFMGLFFYRTKVWPCKPWGMGLLSLCGIAGLILFAWGTSLPVFAVAAVLYGCYSGGFFMCMSFHAVSSRHRMSQNVAIVEGIVGGTSLIAPVMGLLITLTHNTALPLYLCSAAVVQSLLVQFIRCWPYRNLSCSEQ